MAAQLRALTSETTFGKCVHDQVDGKCARRLSIRSFRSHPAHSTLDSIRTTDAFDGNWKQSFPTLVAIGFCERGFAAGQPNRGNREATSSFYNSIRNMPLLEALVGTNSSGLYDAIFDVDTIPEEDLFNDLEEDERPALRSIASSTRLRGNRSRGRTPGPGPAPAANVQSPPTSPTSPTRTRGTPDVSPTRNPMTVVTTNLLEPGHLGEASSGKMSPLARLFAVDSSIRGRTTSMGAGASLKKVEALLEDIKRMPVSKVTEEIKELQVRLVCLLTFFTDSPYWDPWAIGFTSN